MKGLRVAFFTDCYHEVNGVALTSRELVSFARRRSLPLFSVHAGARPAVGREESITTWEFARGPVRWQFEADLAVDLLFARYRKALFQELREFHPDLVHVTSPGDAGILGAWAAHELKVPLAASWHTNLHEYAGRRLRRVLGFLPAAARASASGWTERWVLERCVWFYRRARVVFAPNPELVEQLGRRTGRPVFLMQRGIDTGLFSPQRRRRRDTAFVIGYVGRLSPEKDVRKLVEVERALIAAGLSDYRLLVVGEGSEREGLRRALRAAELPGVLRGEELAQAYASMDVLAFPSSTDTFGNVVLEAMASGVPAIVTGAGGPRFLVRDGETGYVAADVAGFRDAVLELCGNPAKHAAMRRAARAAAEAHSWDRVFEGVYDGDRKSVV